MNEPSARPVPGPRRITLVALVTVLSAVATFVSWGLLAEASAAHPEREPLFLTLAALDPILGIAAIVLFTRVLRREDDDDARERRAVRAAVGAIALAAISGAALVPAVGSLISIAGRRRWPWIGLTSTVMLVAAAVNLWLTQPALAVVDVLLMMGLIAFLVLIGLYRGSRQDLVRSLRQEADAARAGQEALAARARQAERTRIAREMHDSLSHHLALISLHAGALEYREDLDATRARQSAAVIRGTAEAAANELRAVLTVLREDPADTTPAPSLDRLETLAGDVRATGTPVALSLAVTPEPPAAVTAHVVRVVQEALTNAVRHAPGQGVDVVVAGTPGDGVRVTVTNPVGGGSLGGGTGLGLVGLGERLSLIGGTFTAGERSGRFVVEAWVPWET